jgi:hypothetical protein
MSVENVPNPLDGMSKEQMEVLVADIQARIKASEECDDLGPVEGAVVKKKVVKKKAAKKKAVRKKAVKKKATKKKATRKKTVKVVDDFTMNKVEDVEGQRITMGQTPMINTFVDEGASAEEVEDSEVIEKRMRSRAARNRPKFEKIEKMCSICHRAEMIPPGDAVGQYYRCNRCIGG